MNWPLLYKRLKAWERYRPLPYYDGTGELVVFAESKGAPTVGYGYNLLNGMTIAEANALLKIRARDAVTIAKRWAGQGWDKATGSQKAAMAEMAYNLGSTRLAYFVQTQAAVHDGDFPAAAAICLLNGDRSGPSLWYSQVGKRAEEIAAILMGSR